MINKLEFVQHPTRKSLSAREVSYWKLNLSRILKIGAEFEFNLPDKPTGTCKGKSFTCPCVHYGGERNCWDGCLNEDTCSKTKNIGTCANKTAKCTEDKCNDCENYKFECIGLYCVNRLIPCADCKEFELDCTKCMYRFDPMKNPDAIREACRNKFNPTGSYGIMGKSGVHSIVKDGSLLGQKGMEIITSGRRVDYWEFYEMSKSIIEESVGRGAYTNERCSIHMHALASYYGKTDGMSSRAGVKTNELERNMPEIILANFHQLIRRYQNAITWMSTGLDDPNHLTRWEKFRVSILKISAVRNSMQDVKEKVSAESGGNKYGWVNYRMCEFGPDNGIQRLHTEVRVMDGILSPSAVAAMSCLYYSLFIKAVELSRYGIMKVGGKDWLSQALEIKGALMNNTASWDEGNKLGRFSDTSQLTSYVKALTSESFELISQVKHILVQVGPAYEVLEKLAESPCSVSRCGGKSWEEIEDELKVELTEEGALEYEIKRIIDTRQFVNIENISDWSDEVAGVVIDNKNLGLNDLTPEEVIIKIHEYVEDKQINGDILWASKIGSVIHI